MNIIEIIILALSFVGIFLVRLILYNDADGGFLFGIAGMVLAAFIMTIVEESRIKGETN